MCCHIVTCQSFGGVFVLLLFFFGGGDGGGGLLLFFSDDMVAFVTGVRSLPFSLLQAKIASFTACMHSQLTRRGETFAIIYVCKSFVRSPWFYWDTWVFKYVL